MAKKVVGLTARGVETVKTPGLYADGHGLYLQVTATGVKTWIFRYVSPSGESKGKRRDMGLGPIKLLGLADARRKAFELRNQIQEGVDPLGERKTQQAAQALDLAQAQAATKAITFQECGEAYVKAMRPGWKNLKHADQWTSTLETYAYPVLGELPVGNIDINSVLKVLEPIWVGKTETASRLRGRIEAILDYARIRGYRSGENPARWKGYLDHILPAKGDVATVQHHSSLPYTQMPEFWPKLQVQDGLSARALELCVLTATRTSDVLGVKSQEVAHSV